MANFSHSITITWTRGYGETLSQTVTQSNTGEDNINVNMTTSNTNYAIDVQIDPAKVKTLVLMSDAANLTVNTAYANNTVIDTLNLVTNTPLIWYTSSGYDIPIGGVNHDAVAEKLFVTNGSTNTNTNLSLRILRDASV